MTELRPATPDDATVIARIWHDGWYDGHLGHVADELVALRTRESFDRRAAQRVDDTVVATVDGAAAGFIMVVGDEVEQVYVAPEHRGTGLAAALLEGVLDDFTRADLAHADLTGRNLTGIRWSDWGTTWPPGTDTGALRAQSQEVGDGNGIFVIIGPGHDDKARHHARA